MADAVRIVGLGGSLRQGSTSLSALRVALEGMASAHVQAEVLSIRELDLPLYTPEHAPPASARRLADAVHGADALIWSSPTYQGSVSGAFKNALDWLVLLADRDPPYLTGKPVGLITTAGGVQGLQAINTMEFSVRALRGWAVPLVLPLPHSWETFDADGRLTDERTADQLRALAAEVVRAARQFRLDGSCDYAEDRVFAASAPEA